MTIPLANALMRAGSMAWVVLALGCGGGGDGVTLTKATVCSGSYSACGGDPTGTWDLAGVCVEGDLAASADAQLSSKYAACAGSITNATVAGGGSVTYSGGNATYDAKEELVSTLAYSPACVAAISSGATLSASVCTQVQSNLNAETNTKGNCSYDGSHCNCTMTVTNPDTVTHTFSVSGSTISESDGSSYQFCVNGSSMSQRQSVGGSTYIISQFSKR
jgi:hypothetical protein